MGSSLVFKRLYSVTSRLCRARGRLPLLATGILAFVLLATPVLGHQTGAEPDLNPVQAGRDDMDAHPLARNSELDEIAAAYVASIIEQRDTSLGSLDRAILIDQVRDVLPARTSDPIRVGVVVGHAPTLDAAIRDMAGRDGHGPALLDPVLTDFGLAWSEAPETRTWHVTQPDAPGGFVNLQGQIIVVAIAAGSD